jgi:hypothetical protein
MRGRLARPYRDRGRTLVAMLLLAFLTAAAAPVPRTARPGDRPEPGTYAVTICNSVCAESTSGVRGYLVLGPGTVSLSTVPRSVLAYFEDRTRLLMVLEDRGESPNACFVLEAGPAVRGFAGSTPVGLTRWHSTPGDSIQVLLHQSPDAAYVSQFEIREGIISGRGWSGGRGDAAVSLPDDTIRGHRIGPPDFRRCYAAADAEARKPLPLPGSPFP